MKEDEKRADVAELEALLDKIRATYRLTDEQIAVKAGYSAGYIAQTLSRKSVPAKLIRALTKEFSDAGKIDGVSELEAVLAVVVDRLSELCADKSGRSVSVERALIEKDAKELSKIRKA